jgi:D-alanyl-D-alanine dipeptidase
MKRLLLILMLCQSALLFAQKSTQNPYGLDIINTETAYRNSIKKNPDNVLIDIKKAIPGIVLDIRYASKNNFMQRVMYPKAKAFARKPVVDQLRKIQAKLKAKGYGLKIYDAYRPYAITMAFYQQASDKHFVAHPKSGSRHNRGCAIDLSIINLKTKKELPMPTAYDSFSAAAAPNYKNLPPQVIKNRNFLIKTMQSYGFRVMYNEWWHFDFEGWDRFKLMDIPFNKL